MYSCFRNKFTLDKYNLLYVCHERNLNRLIDDLFSIYILLLYEIKSINNFYFERNFRVWFELCLGLFCNI